jgi:hypothetical protein
MPLRARVSPPHGTGRGRELEGSAAPEHSRVRAGATTLFTAAVSLADPYAAAGRYDDVIHRTEGLKNDDGGSALLLTYRGMALRQQGFHDAACGVHQLGARSWEADLGRSSEIGRRGQGDATVNLSVFRRHPSGASALRFACKSG